MVSALGSSSDILYATNYIQFSAAFPPPHSPFSAKLWSTSSKPGYNRITVSNAIYSFIDWVSLNTRVTPSRLRYSLLTDTSKWNPATLPSTWGKFSVDITGLTLNWSFLKGAWLGMGSYRGKSLFAEISNPRSIGPESGAPSPARYSPDHNSLLGHILIFLTSSWHWK